MAILVLVAVDADYFLMLAYLVLCYAHLHGLIRLLALDERRLVGQLRLQLLYFIAQAVDEP